jgi:hypothetical protein
MKSGLCDESKKFSWIFIELKHFYKLFFEQRKIVLPAPL